jgi:hypothetical protein
LRYRRASGSPGHEEHEGEEKGDMKIRGDKESTFYKKPKKYLRNN